MLRDGDLVELHFHGTLDDGSVFDSSRDRRARVFVIGRGQLIPAFEAQLRDMSVGERRSFRLEAGEAYGDRDPSLVFEVPRDDAPPDAAIGDEIPVTGGRPAIVTAIGDHTVTLDGNHPLAGHALNFDVEVTSAGPAQA
jgi:FKBP-type peptidyl-prolyl cis-trans isomerase 2